MKKIFLILALTALISIGVNAEENKKNIILNDPEWTYEINGKEYKTDITSFDDPVKEIKNQLLEQTVFIVPQKNKKPSITKVIHKEQPIPQNNLADSFMDAFGMKAGAAGDTGKGAPGMNSSGRGGSIAAGMSAISTTSSNQVTPPFTPYSYK